MIPGKSSEIHLVYSKKRTRRQNLLHRPSKLSSKRLLVPSVGAKASNAVAKARQK
jgi:hypothetical protein